MRSTDGRHWIALDHVRAFAALMVFSWHFLHGFTGKPIPYDYTPSIFPLAALEQGYAGVALFMTLSGYLFAKLLSGKEIIYSRFFWNRFIRLAPLLVFTFALFSIVQPLQFPTFSYRSYAHDLLTGFVLPTWPNGGWSIAVEMQFYLLLPGVFFLTRRWAPGLPLLVLAAFILRSILFAHYGTAQNFVYFTIIGHLDQFILGILAFQYRELTRGRHLATGTIGMLALFGLAVSIRHMGFDKDPSPNFIWVWMPALQGLAFAWVIAYYDSSFSLSTQGFSKVLGRIGTYSYSIYLLHPFLVFRLPLFINHRIVTLSNFYVACAASLICFCGMACVGWASYSLIERPFLRLRVRYTKPSAKPFSELATA